MPAGSDYLPKGEVSLCTSRGVSRRVTRVKNTSSSTVKSGLRLRSSVCNLLLTNGLQLTPTPIRMASDVPMFLAGSCVRRRLGYVEKCPTDPEEGNGGGSEMRKASVSTTIAIAIGSLFITGCATKAYVWNNTTPIEKKVDQVDQESQK